MKRFLLSVGFVCMSVLPAAAVSPWSVSLSPGIAIPQGDTADLMKNGFAIDGAGEYLFNPMLSAGLEAGYSNHTLEGTLNGVGFTSDIHNSFLHATPYAKLGHTFELQSFKIRPYMLAGFGYYHLHYTDGEIRVGSFRLPVEGASDDFSGINLGAGFDIPVTEQISVGALVHYHEIFEPGEDDKLVVPSLRVAYTF